MRDKDHSASTRASGGLAGFQCRLTLSVDEVTVDSEQEGGATHYCPICGPAEPGCDIRPCRWHHLDTCPYNSILAADVPPVVQTAWPCHPLLFRGEAGLRIHGDVSSTDYRLAETGLDRSVLRFDGPELECHFGHWQQV